MSVRTMRPIPIAAAARIAKVYGYDQVIVIARRVGDEPDPHGEHVTTFGVDAQHCDAAARAGNALKRFMGWPGGAIVEPTKPGAGPAPGPDAPHSTPTLEATGEHVPHGTILPAPEISHD